MNDWRIDSLKPFLDMIKAKPNSVAIGIVEEDCTNPIKLAQERIPGTYVSTTKIRQHYPEDGAQAVYNFMTTYLGSKVTAHHVTRRKTDKYLVFLLTFAQ